jgi:hypothetical protein
MTSYLSPHPPQSYVGMETVSVLVLYSSRVIFYN